MEGDAKPGGLEHVQIVRPVTDTSRLGRGDAKRGAIMGQVSGLGTAVEDRLAYLAKQLAVLDFQMVRVGVVKTALRCNWLGDGSETA